MLSRASVIITILTLCILASSELMAQSDSLLTDSLLVDSLMIDTLSVENDSTNRMQETEKEAIVDDPVFYSSIDSMSILVVDQRVLLWGKGKIEYQDIELTSEFIDSDMEKQEVAAYGVFDSTGNYLGSPNFKKGDEEFEADSMHYNIKTSKGLIYNVKSEQNEGYLHSDLTKRDALGHIHMKGGKYTTCDADHPHFYLELTKAIAIPEDKIVSGPAYLVVQDVPVPLGIPFGFFPSSQRRGSGVIIPTYGEEQRRGFYLRNGGWYQPMGQYVDMIIQGDFYTKGSWAVNWGANYKVNYKFSGNTKIDYYVNKDNSDETYVNNTNFRWTWIHTQDPKANPTQSFSANVNFSNSNYDKTNAYDISQAVNQQKSSSISYTKTWPGTPFNLAVSANATQNSSDSSLAMNLPKGSFSATTIYPFRAKEGTGKLHWYENIGFSYSSQFANDINIKDTMLFENSTWQDMNYGFKHSIPLVINLKSEKIKMLTISPSISYQGVMNSWHIRKHAEYNGAETEIVTDTINELSYAHAINPSITIGLTPKVTGMYLNTRPNPKVIAVRHVMQPRASFSYVPDLSMINPNYYDTVYYTQDGELMKEGYSYFERNIYSTPGYASESGSLSLGLSNSLEMKMAPKSDTAANAEPRKVSLLKSFNFSTSYNPYAKEYKWSDLSLTTSTSLFKNKLNLNLNSRYSPYDFEATDTSSAGVISYSKVDEFLYDNDKFVYRLTSLSLSASLSLQSKQADNNKEQDRNNEDRGPYDATQDPFSSNYIPPGFGYGTYVDFSIPWSLSFSYSWSLNRQYTKENQTVTNTLNVSGDFSLTPKWKIGFNSGYDFEAKEVVMTNFNIHRDLHCWEMRFTMTPFGTYQNYSFTINAKASMLRDLKYDKNQSWYDNL